MTPLDMRLCLLSHGFEPTPVNGKAAVMKGWQTCDVTPDQIRIWDRPPPHGYATARSTGILTRHNPALDIDILDADAAEAVWQLIKDRYGEFGRVFPRVGKPPKRAIVFRTSQPFNKITALLLAPNEDYATPDRPVRPGQRIEFLGVGQQIVVDGIHPDTREPYRWGDGAHLMLCDHLVAELKACHDAQTGAINELWRKMARPATSPTKTMPTI